jgi:uncharacterized membrane protein
MPDDLTLLDVAAPLALGTIWVGYNALCRGRFRQPNSISAQMIALRQAWMTRLLRRDNRTMDAALVGQSIHSATVFTLTTVILLAGLLGVLVLTEQVPSATANLSLRLPGNTQALFEFKLFLLVGMLMYAFLHGTRLFHANRSLCAWIGVGLNSHSKCNTGMFRSCDGKDL